MYYALYFCIFIYFICLALATTRTSQPVDDSPRAKFASVFQPLVRNGWMPSFLDKWEDWFVLTNTTADKRFPGKLKCKLYNTMYNV